MCGGHYEVEMLGGVLNMIPEQEPHSARELRAVVLAVMIFACTALTLAWSVFSRAGIYAYETSRLMELASSLIFLCLCILVVFRPRLAYWTGLGTGLFLLAWITKQKLSYFHVANHW